MIHIKELAEYIEEQLCDARKYACKAMEYQDANAALSKMYADLSKAQLEHADRQYKMLTQMMTQALGALK